jgi:hypothetical protein
VRCSSTDCARTPSARPEARATSTTGSCSPARTATRSRPGA